MKKNKGFTLVELLSVMALLSVIALMIYPLVDDYVSNSRQKGYDNQIDNMIAAAKNWAADNTTKLPDQGNTVTVTLGTLIDGGYSETVTNPKTKTAFSTATKINIKNNNGAFEYTVVVP